MKKFFDYKAWILDFDGTLFYQLPMRIFMAAWLVLYYLPRPHRWKELLMLREYRRLREKLFAAESKNSHQLQLENLSQRYNMSVQKILAVMQDWMTEKPKIFIKTFQRKNLVAAIKSAQLRGIMIVIYSDNPVSEKVKALNFLPDYAFWSDDDLIKCMKPNADGLKNIVKLLKLNHKEILYIGDRDDRDGLCAKNASVDYCDVKKFVNLSKA